MSSSAPGTYTPGLARRKLLVILLGLALVTVGVAQIWTPLSLLVFGQRAQADATRVIKTKEGLPDIVLTTDAQILAQQEPRDRTYTFWNEFRFQTRAGRPIEIRAPVGSLVKPLYELVDGDGLPTSDLIYYDPARPQVVVFPLIISTWFAPGVIIFVGLLCLLIGSFLIYYANKPIELPHIPSATKSDP